MKAFAKTSPVEDTLHPQDSELALGPFLEMCLQASQACGYGLQLSVLKILLNKTDFSRVQLSTTAMFTLTNIF